MSENENEKKFKQNKYTLPVLSLVLLLAVLVILSFLFLYGIISGVSDRDRNVITLFPQDGNVNDSLLITDYKMIKERSDLTVTDQNKVIWESHTNVDLFKSAYTNENGEIIAKSGDGSKIIAPGASNAYDFTVKNTGNMHLNYIITLNSVFDLDSVNLPVKVRFARNGEWICGGEEKWESPFALSKIDSIEDIGVGKENSYRFEWRWPYESELGDELDTRLGDLAESRNLYFKLEIVTSTEAVPGAFPVDEHGVPLAVKWRSFLAMIGLPLAAGIGLIIILLLFRRKIFVSVIFPETLPVLRPAALVKLTRRKDEIRFDGRTMIAGVTFGKKKKLRLIEEDSEGNELEIACLEFALKRKKDINGVEYAVDDDGYLTVTVDKKVRAWEVFAFMREGAIELRFEKSACIDKKHNVYVYGQEEVLPPDDDNCNVTPNGLRVDDDNYYTTVHSFDPAAPGKSGSASVSGDSGE